MNIVIAIDSLKGSLTSMEAGYAIQEGIMKANPAHNGTGSSAGRWGRRNRRGTGGRYEWYRSQR